ncbi:MAG: transcription factor S [Candidatus Bathyarchaeota archaeon]
MEFCPKCEMRLVLTQKTSNNDEVSTFLTCPKCDYQRKVTSEELTLAKIVERPAPERVAVIDNESANLRTMPTTKVECPKCGNREAFWWMVQTRGSDESPTQFFRCTKCEYTWREMA